MPEDDLFQVFVRRLAALDLRYMVTGSVAATLYGEPRLTHDVDIVLELEPFGPRVHDLAEAFPIDEFYCPPEQVIRQEALRRQRGHFNLIAHATGFKADIYLVNEDALHIAALERRRLLPLEGGEVWVAPPEYVVVRKLEYFREGGSEKHLRDVRGLLHGSGELIDRALLAQWLQRLGLEAQWAKVSDALRTA